MPVRKRPQFGCGFWQSNFCLKKDFMVHKRIYSFTRKTWSFFYRTFQCLLRYVFVSIVYVTFELHFLCFNTDGSLNSTKV
jgi:hypothetical protein